VERDECVPRVRLECRKERSEHPVKTHFAGTDENHNNRENKNILTLLCVDIGGGGVFGLLLIVLPSQLQQPQV
jgi:hypothetical protein